MRRQLAAELEPQGVRVITIITGGIPESVTGGVAPDEGTSMPDHWSEVVQGIVDATMIGKAATYEDVGNAAVFIASDQAAMMTAATVNISGGAVID